MDDFRDTLPMRLRGRQTIAGLEPWHAEQFLGEHIRTANLQSQGSTAAPPPRLASELHPSCRSLCQATLLKRIRRINDDKFYLAL
jgi:hypothetical protein